MAEEERVIVEKAFEEWMRGSRHVTRLFAPQMTWEIAGLSAASAKYGSAEEFIAQVLEPFGRRFSESEPFRPVKIRGVYADGPSVIVLWDGAGRTITGTTYENTNAWVLTLDEGMIVDGIAFYDSIAFNELWEIAPRVG